MPHPSGENHYAFGRHISTGSRCRMSKAKRGELHVRAVRPDVELIKQLRLEHRSLQDIADTLGMKVTVVGDVLRGTHWSVRKEYVQRNEPRVL